VGGVCYRVVLEHGSRLGLDGWCVGHAFISVSCVFSMFVVYVLVVYAWCWSWLYLCRHVKVDGVLLEVFIMIIVQ